jgi:2-isopropylmalate synthase
MKKFYAKVIGWAMDTNSFVTISSHNHNDLGMADINSLALVFAAAEHAASTGRNVKTQIEATVCGLGERAGNADMFPVVAGLHKFSDEFASEVTWQFNPNQSVRVANAVMGYAGLEVDRQNPVVGSDILTHRSGIHSDGVIKGGYQIYTSTIPTFWGHETDARHEEGRYQGKKGRDFIAQQS